MGNDQVGERVDPHPADQHPVSGEPVEEELADSTERTDYELVPIDASLLKNVGVLRALAGVVIGLAVLAWPNRSNLILSRLVGIGFLWLSLTSGLVLIRQGPRRLAPVLMSIAGLLAGGFLLTNPDRSTAFLGRLLGVTLLALAIRQITQAQAGGQTGASRRTRYAVSAALGAAGLVMLVFPEDLLAAATSLTAMAGIGLSLVVVLVSLDARTAGTTSYRGALELTGLWLRERPKSVDARQALYAKILYEGDQARQKVIRFFVLMGFAVVIASMGVLTDSTAVVIGAMLIAPLMTPLMGMAISLVMGWPNRLTRSALIAFTGIAFAIGIGTLIGLVAPAVIDTATNSQITGRSSPTILDLVIAVAAGGAGAYGLSRPDVSDALPGVAVAISLVPPLAVVGISYSQGDWSSGSGALLLFATNMMAILIVGGLTFVITGVTPVARIAENQHRVGTAVASVVVAAAVVVGALLLNGTQSAQNLFEQSRTESTIEDWLAETATHRFVSADIDGDTVTTVVIGPVDGLPAVQDLASDLSESLDRSITVDLRLIVEERLTATGG